MKGGTSCMKLYTIRRFVIHSKCKICIIIFVCMEFFPDKQFYAKKHWSFEPVHKFPYAVIKLEFLDQKFPKFYEPLDFIWIWRTEIIVMIRRAGGIILTRYFRQRVKNQNIRKKNIKRNSGAFCDVLPDNLFKIDVDFYIPPKMLLNSRTIVKQFKHFQTMK